ncbi:Pre-mRNA-processing factor [Echinococcus granulosus]|uniref:Pre-mRNA-processing factor 19 n=1 Tax=Echinococcus granulosus TaxID=6210 RepID=W6V4F6_ECHGR|nr:Pre-mRNA-processing factor [Echinococcus granulosus]EUB61014.1 Pre-mRNA-processing factor [Echinococcus granulosus]
MSLCCSLSNEVPEEPVLSPRSGHIFERRLIEKYLTETGCDPINQQPLSPEELIEVKTSPLVRPKPPYATSIPAILKTLQDEWDAVMLHSFTLRQQLQTARQELSHALYQHDAACRVISRYWGYRIQPSRSRAMLIMGLLIMSRLMKEVTAAREALATLKPHTGIGAAAQPAVQAQDVSEAPAADSANLQEEVGLSEQVITRLQERAAQLTEERKKRGKTIPEGLARSRDISEYKQIASLVGMHSPSIPGILCLDASETVPERIITGGNDKNAVVFNTQASQLTVSNCLLSTILYFHPKVVSILRGHTKKVTRVVYHHSEQLAFTASPDCTVRVWGVEQAQCASVIRAHAGPVTGLSLHAIGDYLLSSSADGQWALSDLRRGQVLVRVTVEKGGSLQGLTCAQFHPDGQILATGTVDGEVKIWDIRERRNAANFTHGMGANQPLTAVSFSENGYYLATGGADGQIKLWDLRKLKNFRTLTPELERANSVYEINDLEFDQSGCYLAVAGSDVRVYLCKQWDELVTFTAHTSPATGVRFGPNAKSVISCSLDRSVKIYGTGPGEAGDGDSAMET